MPFRHRTRIASYALLATLLLLPWRAWAACGVGETESTFSVAATADDATAKRSDASNWPPASSNSQDAAGGTQTIQRTYTSTYQHEIALWRWNTATQPDTTAWPANTVVKSARVGVRYTYSITINESNKVIYEWYPWTPAVSNSMWAYTYPSSGDTTYAGEWTPVGSGDYVYTDLTHLTEINLSGYTGIRAMLSGGTPTALNTVEFRTFDHGSVYPEKLIVCWKEEAPTATPTPATTNTPTVTPTRTPTPTSPPGCCNCGGSVGCHTPVANDTPCPATPGCTYSAGSQCMPNPG